MQGPMTPLERFEFYKAMVPGKNFQMLAPSLSRLRSPSPEDQSSTSSPAAPEASKEGPLSDKG